MVVHYWVSLNEDKLSCDYYELFKEIKFNSPNLKKVEIDEIEKKEELLFSAIIFENESVLSDYSESKFFYSATIYDQNLLNIIISNKITSVFQLVNFNKQWPYLLINNKKEMFVYYNTVIDETIGYNILSCQEYFPR